MDDNGYHRLMLSIQTIVEQYVKFKGCGDAVRVIYSAYETDDHGIPVDNLEEVAIEGRVQFVQEHDGFWGEGEDYISEVVENPTWLDVTFYANEMIGITGDHHHVYLEGVHKSETTIAADGKPVDVYEFGMGS